MTTKTGLKHAEQNAINHEVLSALNRFSMETKGVTFGNWVRLRSCSAHVANVLHYEVLMSYQTIVAIIDTDTNTLYDFLRYVYGYTSTSAQHISKFAHDYGGGQWGCAHRLTYREA